MFNSRILIQYASPEEQKWVIEALEDVEFGEENQRYSLEILATYKLLLWYTYSTYLSHVTIAGDISKLQNRLFFLSDNQGKIKKIRETLTPTELNIFDFSFIQESKWSELLEEIGLPQRQIERMKGLFGKRHSIAHATGTIGEIVRKDFIEGAESILGEIDLCRDRFISTGKVQSEIETVEDLEIVVNDYFLRYRCVYRDAGKIKEMFGDSSFSLGKTETLEWLNNNLISEDA